ncbi:MAG: dihydrodipicolinate synthase family protein, partial [Candidatus Omnitrophica bacterium]|nr:dihydrodipicolinate synthase family protein [Candidatus Omnitrophota bacterium]
MFKGSYVALVTPFKNGKIDEKRYAELIEFQIKNGTDGIVPAGCTGEAATLNHDEQKRLMDFVVG